MTRDELLTSTAATFTVDEIYPVLRVSRGLAYQGVRDGTIKSIRIGRTYRIPRRAVFELLGEPVPEDGASLAFDQAQGSLRDRDTL